jgi:hypothetical protein
MHTRFAVAGVFVAVLVCAACESNEVRIARERRERAQAEAAAAQAGAFLAFVLVAGVVGLVVVGCRHHAELVKARTIAASTPLPPPEPTLEDKLRELYAEHERLLAIPGGSDATKRQIETWCEERAAELFPVQPQPIPAAPDFATLDLPRHVPTRTDFLDDARPYEPPRVDRIA